MFKQLIQTMPLIILIALSAVTAIHSQEISAKPGEDSAAISRSIQPADECAQLLQKTLDAYEKLKIAAAAANAELATNKSLREKEEAYNLQLLEAVKLLVSSEKRSKSFFEKLAKKLEKVLESATDPKVLVTIATLIILAKSK